MNNYSESNQTVSKLPVDVHELQVQLDQALGTIERLEKERLTAQFMVEQANAARDDYTQRYQGSLKDIERLEKQLSQKDSRIEALFMELQWIRKIHYNPTFKPAERDVLITAHDHARTGDEVRIFVGTKAKQTGMSRNTYGPTLQKLGELGVIEWRNTDPENNKKGKITEEVYIKFTEQLLKNPDEIVIDRGPENRGGNAKEKAAKKSCPNCNSIQLEQGKVCYCKNCNHQWEEGNRKEVNIITPDDMAREAVNVKKPSEVTSPDETLLQHMDTLFPEMQEEQKVEVNGDDRQPLLSFAQDTANRPPRPHPLCHPKANWAYDDLIEKWFCEVCNHG